MYLDQFRDILLNLHKKLSSLEQPRPWCLVWKSLTLKSKKLLPGPLATLLVIMLVTYTYYLPNSIELSQSVVDAGAVPLLVLCVQEPELGVKRIAASALSDIAKHTPEVVH